MEIVGGTKKSNETHPNRPQISQINGRIKNKFRDIGHVQADN